jgi:vancomycin resistance protein VanW
VVNLVRGLTSLRDRTILTALDCEGLVINPAERMNLRGLARRYVPSTARLQLRLLLRALDDKHQNVHFTKSRCEDPTRDFPNLVCRYKRPIVDYAGQTQFGAAKRHNLGLIASKLTSTVIAPGETFSIWHLAGEPTERAGYMRAAGLHNRQVTGDVGGSTCLMSTVLYNLGLLGAMDVTERHCHSIDLYGEDRYFELGRDASIEYGYLDLRFSNPHPFPVLLTAETTPNSVIGALYSPVTHRFSVDVEVDAPAVTQPEEQFVVDQRLTDGVMTVVQESRPGLSVTARRIIRFGDGSVREEDLPGSLHHPVPGIVAVGSLTATNRVTL